MGFLLSYKHRHALIFALLALLLAFALAGCAGQDDASGTTGGQGGTQGTEGTEGTGGTDGTGTDGGNAQPGGQRDRPLAAADGEDLVIEVAGITEQASFFPVEAGGTRMEVIAVKAPDGTIRTAFNTCQVCFDSGRGYYEQSGDRLVCQNCGNQFPMDRVEVEAGGCNPWPIFADDKTVTDGTITISAAFLQESQQIFANWKSAY
ncbi:MAG: DUF2318 domain-containing protein [Clostridiales Family XIII bacterium]|jgi:hypothetical protein|nr:DUF2318 domain-containing protein [Clostridiales Family XIII bacterium]